MFNVKKQNVLKINVVFNPNQNHLTDIKSWLEKEDSELKEGFFCNWNVIECAYKQRKIVVITENTYAIGFLVYTITDFIAEIIIAEIKPDKRKNGIGRLLIEESLQFFKEKGAFISQLYCAPVESEKIWKKIGFSNFPKGIVRDSKIRLYRILIQTEAQVNSDFYAERIELHGERNNWIWEVKRKENSNQLEKPIIHPANNEWQLIWKNQDEIYEESIVKRFNLNGADHGYFLIINELQKKH